VGEGLKIPENYKTLEIGKGRIISEGTKVAIINLGTRLVEVKKASEKLNSLGLSTTIIDARFAKPLDESLIISAAKNHELLLTIEEDHLEGLDLLFCLYCLMLHC
jgi:1-deoxy-D-xylulose-5-phosphate synthase